MQEQPKNIKDILNNVAFTPEERNMFSKIKPFIPLDNIENLQNFLKEVIRSEPARKTFLKKCDFSINEIPSRAQLKRIQMKIHFTRAYIQKKHVK